MEFGTLKSTNVHSPLESLATVRPKGGGRGMIEMVAPVMLTSLVDAFAIIVVYLLVSTQNSGGKELELNKNISLPKASTSNTLSLGVNIQVVDGKYMVEEKVYNAGELLAHLTELNKSLESSGDERKGKIVIQADKKSDFNNISPILSIAAQSGFENIKFAVLGE